MPGRVSDERLIAAFRGGDETAFQQIHDRYRPALLRFATRILRDGGTAEDVVQEALWRAHRALRRDDRPMNLRPWLYRLVRNCSLDELGRVRTDCVDLHAIDGDGALTAALRDEPPAAYQRRADLRQLLDDLGALPARHRHALVRRELDGLSHRQLASELDITPSAARVVVYRARVALMQVVDERSTSCEAVRTNLLEAHDARRRASAQTHRHLARCAECREFRAALRKTRRAMAILLPGPLVLLAAGGAGLKIGLAGKASAGKVAAGAATATLAVGAAGLALPTLGPGDPAPTTISSPALPGGHLGRGAPLPAGTAIVRRAVTLHAGTSAPAAVVLRCPSGLRVADLLAPSGARLNATYGPGVVVGASRSAQVVLERNALAYNMRASASVAVLCKRPSRGGSIVAGGGAGAAAAAGVAVPHPTLVRATAFLYAKPSRGSVVGTVRREQPVRVVARPRGGSWLRVVTDTGQRGWVASQLLSPTPHR
ncbi:sigma-70 family RNA polymerase sigma factor [Baekduia sp.]|uniref:sigma-70 family RNA polymerase sigma factor n=1 Tax=Baekduia sp. TaxID=2600305 RepID=UPI002DFB9340|nr:sigma-70 family RNA polymerase sigma factor [Baekduia sp.]